MGQKHSSGSKHHHHTHSTSSGDGGVSAGEAGTGASPPPPRTPIVFDAHVSPTFVGFTERDASRFQIMTSAGAADIHAAIPPGDVPRHPDTWHLLYNSFVHGSSFNRLVQLIADRGPTVIVIRDGSSGRVFGGYNEVSWTTVAQREKDARSMAAANSRAKRNGMHDMVVGRPDNQSVTFFGNERCFLFSLAAAVPGQAEEGDEAGGGSAGAIIYRSRPHVNSNFMYLFDTHPDEDRVGIGMGGAPPCHLGWFLNKWLEKGACRGTRCTTFHNPMLSATEDWQVDGVEVYAVGRDVVEELKASEVLPDGKTALDDGRSIRKGNHVKADKIILEMDQRHHFYADEDARCMSKNSSFAALE